MPSSSVPADVEGCIPDRSESSKVAWLENLHQYRLAAELACGNDVLDIACGEGCGSDIAAAQAKSVVGVDENAAAVAQARSAGSQPTQPDARRTDCRAFRPIATTPNASP